LALRCQLSLTNGENAFLVSLQTSSQIITAALFKIVLEPIQQNLPIKLFFYKFTDKTLFEFANPTFYKFINKAFHFQS
jgi:hypothetical protein